MVLMQLPSLLPWHAEEPINAVLGDVSFVSKYSRAPGPADSESTRIKAHFAYMLERLRAKDVSCLAAGQLKSRTELLEALDDYAEEGRFPANMETFARTPIFIDSAGTPCAVAHLMQKSGYSALAARVDSDFHYAYLQDLCNGSSEVAREVAKWAQNHGFDVNDLAEIQPGYTAQDQAAMALIFFTMVGLGLSHLFSLPLGILAAVRLWPCAATFQFIAGAVNSLISMLAFLLHWNLSSTYAFSKTFFIRFTAICTCLGLVNTWAATLVLNGSVCQASKAEIIVSWVFCAIPLLVILPFLVVLVVVNACCPKKDMLRRKRRAPKTSSQPQQALYHQSWYPPQSNIGIGPVQAPLVQPAYFVPPQSSLVPAGFTPMPPMPYTGPPVQFARADVPVMPVNNPYLPQIAYAPPRLLRTLSYSTSQAFGFQDPYAKLAVDNVSTNAGSDGVLDDIDPSDSE
mmetsp:Transcript_59757/g.106574  ORF Transcript_59757/g.106574 Transcript_59757/m.106574 type:complete len:457 (-) Transcript_59757:161-1531(-)